MSAHLQTQPFRPWRQDWGRAGLFAAISLILLVAMSNAQRHQVWLFAAAAASFLLARFFWRRASARRRGKVIEKNALRELKHVVAKSVDIQTEILTPHGDIDALVRDRKTQQVWCLEIKSHSAARVDGGVVRMRGGKSVEPFLEQVRRNAREHAAQPVLWFPAARVSTAGWVNDVLVVTGPATHLAKAADLVPLIQLRDRSRR